MKTDAEVRRALSGYADTVRRVCFLHLRRRDQVEDVFQEVFLRHALHDVPFENETHKRAWLIQNAVNVCRDATRTFGPRRGLSLDDVDLTGLTLPPECRDALSAVLQLKQPTCRDAVYLHCCEGYQTREIAAILQTREKEIDTCLSRAAAQRKALPGMAGPENDVHAAFESIRVDADLVEDTAVRLDELREARETRRPRKPLVRLAASAAAVVMLAVCIAWPVWYSTAAYVSIDANASVELTVNRFDRVLTAKGLDEAGARALAGLSLAGGRCDEAAATVLSVCVREGYLAGDGLATITVRAANVARERALCDSLRRGIGAQVSSIVVEILPMGAGDP